jgi:hypothetical protein
MVSPCRNCVNTQFPHLKLKSGYARPILGRKIMTAVQPALMNNHTNTIDNTPPAQAPDQHTPMMRQYVDYLILININSYLHIVEIIRATYGLHNYSFSDVQ